MLDSVTHRGLTAVLTPAMQMSVKLLKSLSLLIMIVGEWPAGIDSRVRVGFWVDERSGVRGWWAAGSGTGPGVVTPRA
jgi:hypothetical protein